MTTETQVCFSYQFSIGFTIIIKKHCSLESMFLTFRGIFLFRCQNTSYKYTDPCDLIFRNFQFYLSPTSFCIFTFFSTTGKNSNYFKKKLHMCKQSNIRPIQMILTAASKYSQTNIFGRSCRKVQHFKQQLWSHQGMSFMAWDVWHKHPVSRNRSKLLVKWYLRANEY